MEENNKGKECAVDKFSPSAYWAYQLLHVGFTIAPIVSGADKFFNFMTDWPMYLSPVAIRLLPISPASFMHIVGVVEICAGVVVAVKPKIGGLIVAGWLFLIIINLLVGQGMYDIVLRDVGMLLGAAALALFSRGR